MADYELNGSGPSVSLGSITVTGWKLVDATVAIELGRSVSSHGDSLAVHLLPEGEVGTALGHVIHHAGDLLLADPADPLTVWGPPGHGMTIHGPRRVFAGMLSGAPMPLIAPCSGVSVALGRFLDDLLARAAAVMTAEQAHFAGTAALHFMTAALTTATAPNLAARRTTTLLAHACDFIDRNLGQPIDAGTLSAALGCSRAALYRAVAPAGGVTKLLAQRRLAIVHRLMGDSGERRSVGEIARAYGFDDAAQFGRRFKQRFGITPGQLRRTARAEPENVS